jgi:hypothetical protein
VKLDDHEEEALLVSVTVSAGMTSTKHTTWRAGVFFDF